ncbi:MAG: LamG-like jellyroll fold domain-containing protein, partial [Planctomycetota bacterium]
MRQRAFFQGILAVLIVSLYLCGQVQADVLLVPDEYPTIQSAINAAVDGDVVRVGRGTYPEHIDFHGKDIVVTSTDPNDESVVAGTIIDAGGTGSAVTFAGGETTDAVITGFTIQNGYGTEDPLFGAGLYWGAGIYCSNASPTITRNVIVNNNGPFSQTAPGYGIGIGGVLASPIITRNIIKDNTGFAGAGLMVYLGDARISNNLIYNNTADIGGGVILLYGGQLVNNTIVANTGTMFSGNIYTVSQAGIGQCLISNNIACSALSGGGIFIAGEPGYDIITYNNVWNNADGDYIGIDDQTGENGNISADPLFVQMGGGGLTTGLISHWRFDEGSGSTAHDSVGDNDGNIIGDPNWTTGITDGALRFDGVDDYIDVGYIGECDELSIVLWVNIYSLPHIWNSLFHNNGWESGDVHFIIHSNGRVEFALNSMPDQFSNFAFNSSMFGEWFHITVVYSREARTVDFYIDGQHDVQRTYSAARSAVLGPLRIGGWDWETRNFDGKIDELRLYDRALRADEVRQIYQEGSAVAYWRFDEGSGSTAHDSAGGNDGTIYGAQWTTGKIGRALSFDRNNDYVDVAHRPDFDIGTRFAVQLWFKANPTQLSPDEL